MAKDAIFGVTSVGDELKTRRPEPDSSLITPNNCSDVVAAKNPRLSVFLARLAESVRSVDARVTVVTPAFVMETSPLITTAVGILVAEPTIIRADNTFSNLDN